MNAAPNRQDIRAYDGDPCGFRAPTSSTVFRAAYTELLTRIWIELELLSEAVTRIDSPAPDNLVMSTAILRLELVVLMDSCRSPRWRSMLSASQSDDLCSTLTDVLEALYVDSDQLRQGIEEAQDRTLDALLPN